MSLAPLPPPVRARRSARFYFGGVIGALVLLAVFAAIGLLVYSSSARFSALVTKKIVGVIENATGGRVELRSVHWSLRGLSVSADGLTIHGLEGPGEAPYLHVDRLYARLRIVSFFKPKIALNYVEANHPVFHLIVYPDGATNQPRPRHAGHGSVTDTIFDFEAGRAVVSRGLLLINQRKIPFDLTANDLEALVTYSPAEDRYRGSIRVAGLDLQRGSAAPLDSRLTLEVQLARNAATLKSLHLTGGGAQLDASGSLTGYSDPQWKLAARGSIDIREIAALTGIDGLRRGIAKIDATGQGRGVRQYSIQGNFGIAGAAFQTSYLKVEGAGATAQFSVTPEEIAITGLKANLRQGGGADATIHFLHWNAAAAGGARARAGSRNGVRPGIASSASILARIYGVRLPAIMRMVSPHRYWNLGFDTATSGEVDVNWTGGGEDLTVSGKLRLAPPGHPATGQAPVSGMVDATYFERGGRVRIRHFDAQTPASQIQVTGALGVYPVSGPSALQIHFTTRRLEEFDPALTDLGLAARGRKGIAAIPARLDGQAEFSGSLAGSLIDPDIRGHLTAMNFVSEFGFGGKATHPAAVLEEASGDSPSQPGNLVRWDRLDATGEYSSAAIVIQHATLTRGGATVQLQGRLNADRVGASSYAYDKASTFDLTAGIHHASLADLLEIAGRELPISGTVDLQAQAKGTLAELDGNGRFSIEGGEIAGEPYRSMTAAVAVTGRRINLVSLRLSQDGGVVSATGNYNLASKAIFATLNGSNFELSRVQRLKVTHVPVTGSLNFDAQVSGTLPAPSITAQAHLRNATVQGESAGGLEAAAHTANGVLLFTAQSTLKAAGLELNGQIGLHAPFPAQARLTLTEMDIDPLLRMAKVPDLEGHSVISGTMEVAGPAKEPRKLSGSVEISQFHVTLDTMTITSQGPLLATIQEGVIHITQAHIVGPDTNMNISGSAGPFDGRQLNLNAGGLVNVKLAETFNPDITSSGHVDFRIRAGGSLRHPQLQGQLHLVNVALSLSGVPTGISNLNGMLVFDQDRLELQDLTGWAGGGQLKLGGFVTYQQGIYGNITATGKDVRLRYAGASATADTAFRLQGTEKDMQLSGSVQITRFKVGPTFDYAVFAASPPAMAPTNLSSPSNHIRLNIQITSSPQLDFQNSYAQLAGSVNLRVRGTVAQPTVLGQILITEGTANFAGTTYQLQHGSIYFSNPVRIDPGIDIDATTRIEEYDVTVGLHGSASHLTPTFRSDPPLPQADVISLLALGRTQQEQQLYSQEEEQAGSNPTTNALLGGALNAAVGSRVQRLFGVGSVKIDPTYVGNLGNSTARITVQQNVSRNVQLTYATNVNTTAEQLIQAQVNLTQNVSVLAVRDEAGVFSMVLKIHRRAR